MYNSSVIYSTVNSGVLTPNAAKALDKLGPLLALVCDYLQRGSKFLVVVGEPLQQWHALNELMFLPRLKNNQSETDGMIGKLGQGSNRNHRDLLLFAGLTSLSVKWDLSFSCSGVKYKVFSSEKQKRHLDFSILIFITMFVSNDS